MITIDQIQVGTRFHLMGSDWVVDSIESYNVLTNLFEYKILVSTSVIGGPKGNYRTELNDLVNYLNEVGTKLIN